MKKIDYEVHCPRCGHVIKGRRGEDEHQKSFECKKCTGRWSISFEHPSREELEELFMNDEIPSSLSGPATRVYGPIRSLFSFRLPRLLRSSRQERKPIIFKGRKQ